jgi:hypothetical protein
MILEILSNQITGAEPTYIEDAQIYFRSEDSDGIEDKLIFSLLKQAREAIEKSTNISLIERTVKVYVNEYAGYLPLGPIDPNSLTKISGEVEIRGKAYPYCYWGEDATVEYHSLAYQSEDLINAIYELASFWYFRGDSDRSLPDKIKPVIKRNTRNTFA